MKLGTYFITAALLTLLFASCKKADFLADCPSYTNTSVEQVVSFLSGCDKVWENCYDDGKSYNSARALYKFDANVEGTMLLYRLQGGNAWFHHSFFGYRIAQQNDKIVLIIDKFDNSAPSNKDSAYTYEITIRDKGFVTWTIVNAPKGEEYRIGTKLYRKVYQDDLPSDFYTPTQAPDPNNNNNNNGSGSCSGSYNGPNYDIQIDAHCMQAYNMVCNQGYSKSSSEVQQVCNTYKGMVSCCKPSTPSTYPNCPYCN